MSTITLNYQVSAGEDDASENDDGTSFTATFTDIRFSSSTSAGSRYNSGMRFRNVQLSQGQVIISAFLKPNSFFNSLNCDLLGEDVDNAVSFTTTPDVTSRDRTSASVAWVGAVGSGEITSPDIKTIIQEIVDRASWAKGNALVIFADGKDDFTENYRAWAYEHTDPLLAVKLDITVNVFRGSHGLVIPG